MGGEYDLSARVLSKDRWAVTAYPEAEPALARHPLHLPDTLSPSPATAASEVTCSP